MVTSRRFPGLAAALALLAGCGDAPATAPSQPSAPAALSQPQGTAAGAPQGLGRDALTTWPPVVLAHWSTPLPTGGDPPLSGDPIHFGCDVSLAVGEPLTVTLALSNGSARCFTAGHCWTLTREFLPRVGRPFAGAVGRNDFAPTPAMGGTLTCTATTASGQSATSSTCFAMAGMSCPD